MSSMKKKKIENPEQLAKALEEHHGDAIWRYNWVLPAEHSETNKKEYFWEFPSKTSEEISEGWKSASGKYHFPGRGYKTPKDIPSFMKKDKGGEAPLPLSKMYPAIGIYLKYVKDLFVIDFDGGDEYCTCDEDDNGNPLNAFFKFCMETNTIYIRTKKGYHFYFWMPGVPEFSCSTKLQGEESFGDVDILGRKIPSCFNVIEALHHEVVNGDKGLSGMVSVPWETMKDYLNVARMLGKDKKNLDKQTKKEKIETNAIMSGEVELPADKFKGYLSRLRTEDHRHQQDKKSRYHYEDWLKIGIICKNNFDDDDEGFQVWLDWTREDPDIKVEGHDHQGRNIKYMTEKWESFGEAPTPSTWKSLRKMANDDDPKRNVFQEIFDSSGEDGVVEYMNGFICMNVSTGGEIIHENPDEIKHYSAVPNIFKVDGARTIFSKNSIWIDGKKVNPFQIWMTSPLQRQVNRIVFDPTPSAPTNVYNMFGGFDVSKIDVSDLSHREAEENCQHLLNHIYNIWCGRNQEIYDYCLNWFAYILQRPWIKIGVLLAVKSREGAGKGIVFDYLRHILGGRLYAQINSIDQLIGNHNSVLEGRLLINGDEIVWGGNIKDGNSLKGVITEQEIWIHEKYRARYKIQNTTAICISSNEDRSMSAREGDRRSFGMELANTWAGRQKTPEHKKYFCDISGTNHFGIARDRVEGFAKVLFERDLTNFNPRNPPITELLTDQMERNWTAVQKFWKGVLERGGFSIEDRFKRPTRVDKPETNDYGTKMITTYLDYDNSQLNWGNVGEHYNNGFKEFKWVYDKTINPLRASAVVPNPTHCHSSGHQNSFRFRWEKFLEEVEKRGIATIEDKSKVPIPDMFVKVFNRMSGGNGYEKKSEYSHNASLSSKLRKYEWTDKVSEHPNARFVPLHPYLPDASVRDAHSGMHDMMGLRVEHLQPPIEGDKYGSRPRMIRETNIDGETKYPIWHYDFDKVLWHFEDLDKSWYEKIDKMEQTHDLYQEDEDVPCDLDCNWEAEPVDYLRHCDDCVVLHKIEEKSQFSSNTYMNYPDDFSSMELDEGIIKNYLEKWGNGVNADNFTDDLITREWYDDKGNKLHYCVRKQKITRWCYDKDWVFSRYKETEGLGYGQDKVDEPSFWKSIKEMLGGDKAEGGQFKNIRITLPDGSRPIMWQFVSITKGREMFEKWTGRKVQWEDGDEEDINDMPDSWF